LFISKLRGNTVNIHPCMLNTYNMTVISINI